MPPGFYWVGWVRDTLQRRPIGAPRCCPCPQLAETDGHRSLKAFLVPPVRCVSTWFVFVVPSLALLGGLAGLAHQLAVGGPAALLSSLAAEEYLAAVLAAGRALQLTRSVRVVLAKEVGIPIKLVKHPQFATPMLWDVFCAMLFWLSLLGHGLSDHPASSFRHEWSPFDYSCFSFSADS